MNCEWPALATLCVNDAVQLGHSTQPCVLSITHGSHSVAKRKTPSLWFNYAEKRYERRTYKLPSPICRCNTACIKSQTSPIRQSGHRASIFAHRRRRNRKQTRHCKFALNLASPAPESKRARAPPPKSSSSRHRRTWPRVAVAAQSN